MAITIIDGKNAVLGRVASTTAKKLLAGDAVTIINAEDLLITGDPQRILEKYRERRARGSAHHGPFFPVKPDRIVRRTVRGMLPYKTTKGRAALKRLHIIVGNPDRIEGASVATKRVTTNYIRIGKLAREMGWR